MSEPTKGQVVTGNVAAAPLVSYTKAGKAVVNVLIEKKHGHQDGSKWVSEPSEMFDAHLWQPNTIFNTAKQQEWLKGVLRPLVPGQRVIVHGKEEPEQREITRKDGSKIAVTDITAWEIGPSLRYGGPVVDREQAVDPIAAATAVVEAAGLVDGSEGLV